MRDEIMNYLDNEKMYYDDLANLINNDYDGFLAKVDSQDGNREVNKASDDKLLTFNVQLFNLDPSTKETIKAISKTNPYRSLVENKQEIIE
jgi:DNA replication initiation complex subunit (GINS family)